MDNVDWLEDTPDGRNTSHYLLLVVFQRNIGEKRQFILQNINQKQNALTLNENSFKELLSCNKPNSSLFVRTSGCQNALVSTAEQQVRSKILNHRLYLRSLERLLVEEVAPDENEGEAAKTALLVE